MTALTATLAGRGAITIWQDAREAARADFYAWHNGEHLAERVGIPGFLRGRRYAALAGSPEFFTLYETIDPDVHTGPDYLARLNSPTDTTRRVAPQMVNNVRSLCRVEWTRGTLAGGLVCTLRFDAAEEAAPGLREWLCAGPLPALLGEPGVSAVHLCVADTVASSVKTAEKKDRPVAARVPGWVVIVEGAADREALEAAVDRHLAAAALAERGARELERGLYRLQAWLAR
jgi:hypothetical protein